MNEMQQPMWLRKKDNDLWRLSPFYSADLNSA